MRNFALHLPLSFLRSPSLVLSSLFCLRPFFRSLLSPLVLPFLVFVGGGVLTLLMHVSVSDISL